MSDDQEIRVDPWEENTFVSRFSREIIPFPQQEKLARAAVSWLEAAQNCTDPDLIRQLLQVSVELVFPDNHSLREEAYSLIDRGMFHEYAFRALRAPLQKSGFRFTGNCISENDFGAIYSGDFQDEVFLEFLAFALGSFPRSLQRDIDLVHEFNYEARDFTILIVGLAICSLWFIKTIDHTDSESPHYFVMNKFHKCFLRPEQFSQEDWLDYIEEFGIGYSESYFTTARASLEDFSEKKSNSESE